MRNQVLLLSQNRGAVLPFQTAVSLHGHTRHSHESLGFIGRYLNSKSPLRAWIDGQRDYCRRTSGIALDWNRAYWTPPLCERLAYQLEARQIESLGLRPLVSLSDHNSIEACTLLRATPEFRDAPVSTEWTVPFGRAVFHIGVHNLPPALAQSFMSVMWEATAAASESRSLALLAELASTPGILVVFNHPLWNFEAIASDLFAVELERFLKGASQHLHAFELNGMRGHNENRAVLRLAEDWNQVIIAGGDRHGCEPSALLNLTSAADFPEFVDEIRNRQSTVLIMPQYGEPLCWRFYQNFTHVIADYPGHPEDRRHWDQRTFHPNRDGEITPIANLWRVGPPEPLKAIFAMALAAVNLPIRPLLRRSMRRHNQSLLLLNTRPVIWTRPEGEPAGRPAFGDRDVEACIEECL